MQTRGKEDAVIRVRLEGKRNRYDSCELEFDNNGIVEILCENNAKRKALMELIAGVENINGVSTLDYVDTLKDPEEYKKRVDMIDPEKIVSTLNVKNYIVFFAMVMGIYHESTIEELTNLLCQNGMEDLLDKSVNELSREEKIKVRCIASCLKQVECLVGKDILEDLEPVQIEGMLKFLREHFCDKQCVCLLFENKRMAESSVNEVYTI